MIARPVGIRWATAALVLVAATPAAHAAGINLYWNDCSAGATATNHRSFACDTNVGRNNLTASFDPPDGLTRLNGLNLVIEIKSSVSPLAQWWRFKNAGTCRLTSLLANTVFPEASCIEPWAGSGTAAISAYLENVGGNARHARIGATVSVGSALEGPVSSGTEYYGVNIVINNAKTVGDGSCTGCQDPLCIVLNEIKLTQPAGVEGGSPQIANPRDNAWVFWQTVGAEPPDYLCYTPTLNRTWGTMKSLYR